MGRTTRFRDPSLTLVADEEGEVREDIAAALALLRFDDDGDVVVSNDEDVGGDSDEGAEE